MADGFIEQALLSHSAAFSDATGSMTIACPQIADALNVLYGYIRKLQSDSNELRNQVAMLQSESKRQGERLSDQIDEQADMKQEMTLLQSDQHGFVTMEKLKTYSAGFVDREIVNSLAQDVTELHHWSKNTVLSKEFEVTCKSVLAQGESIEHNRVNVNEEIALLKLNVERLTSDTTSKLDTVNLDHRRQVDAFSAHQEVTKDALLRLNERLTNEIQITRQENSEKLQDTHSEVLHHMKMHAEALDTLQRMKVETISRAPTVAELKEVRSEMDLVRKEIDTAQFKIHEAYSQCLTLAKIGSGVGSGGGAGSNSSSLGTANSILSGATAKSGGHLPNQWQSEDTAEVMLFQNNTSVRDDPSTLLQQIARNSSINSSNVPASVELQMENLKKDVHKLLNVALPSCVGQVLTLKEDVAEMLSVQQRAEQLVQSLCFCLGLDNQGDELLACIRATDRNRVLVLLRKCMETIVGGPLLPATAAVSDASVTASPIGKRLSLASPPSSPKGAPVAQKELNFRLGVDVADVFTTKGKDRGAQVMSVLPGSIAAQAGFLPQDVVLTINGKPLHSCSDFLRELKVATAAARIALAGAKELPDGTPSNSRKFIDMDVHRAGSHTVETLRIPIIFR